MVRPCVARGFRRAGIQRRSPLPPGAGARRAAPLAPAYGPLPPRPREALSPHRQARSGLPAPHHRDGDVPRDGREVLARAGGGGAASAAVVVADFMDESIPLLRP